MDRLEELVYLSIGRASMCWSEIPKGVYNDAYAKQVAQDLLLAIAQHEQKAIERERAVWQLSNPRIIRDSNGNEIARSKSMTG